MKPFYNVIQIRSADQSAAEFATASIVRWLWPQSKTGFQSAVSGTRWLALYPTMQFSFERGAQLPVCCVRVASEVSKELKVPVLNLRSIGPYNLDGEFVWRDKVFSLQNARFQIPVTNSGPVLSIVGALENLLTQGELENCIDAEMGSKFFGYLMAPPVIGPTAIEKMQEITGILGCAFADPEPIWKEQASYEALMPPVFKLDFGNWGEEKYIGDPFRPLVRGQNLGKSSVGIVFTVGGSFFANGLVEEPFCTVTARTQLDSAEVTNQDVPMQKGENGSWRAVVPNVVFLAGEKIQVQLHAETVRRGSGKVVLTLAPLENETGSCSLDFSVKVKAAKAKPPGAEYEQASKRTEFLAALNNLSAAIKVEIAPCRNLPGVFEFSSGESDIDCARLQADVTCGYLCVKKSISPNERKFAVYPTKDKYSVLRFAGTNGDNYGISSQKLLTWLKKLEVTTPFVLTCCNNASMGGRFLTPVTDADKLAAQFLKICPDIGDTQGFVAELQHTQGFLLWWD